MEIKEQNTENIILQAAEEEFLEKGFSGTKTTAIAKRANVNHAMIHYYFRTKDNLFNLVFHRKMELLASSIYSSFDYNKDFLEQLEIVIEKHFNFIEVNPKLLFFLYGEIISNEKRRSLFVKALGPRLQKILAGLKAGLKKEVAKGTIRPIHPVDLFMNIISLNVATFLALPIIEELGATPTEISIHLARRKKHIKEFIIAGIKA